MTYIKLALIDSDGHVRAKGDGIGFARLDMHYITYDPGDCIVLECDNDDAELEIRLDESLLPSTVVLKGGRFVFPIPFGEARDPYGVTAFTGDRHWGYARVIDDRERDNWRNLALNSHDHLTQQSLFPHAATNTGETRPVFMTRNAIDGIWESSRHGRWPYSSWGINGREDALLRIEFGREVDARELVLMLRADYPHDGWWSSIQCTCSNGSVANLPIAKTGDPQRFPLECNRITWIELSHFVRAADSSPWVALSQVAVMGRDAKPFQSHH